MIRPVPAAVVSRTHFVLAVALLVPPLCAHDGHASKTAATQSPRPLLFPPGSPPAKKIDVVNATFASPETRLVLSTLQGVVNAGKQSLHGAQCNLASYHAFGLLPVLASFHHKQSVTTTPHPHTPTLIFT
eukprot:m.319203 g.319203  ORF g.319203 m.319203 type:complete len:130 (+) comp19702_c0_seq8:161-550(+)